MPYPVERLLEVHEDVVEILLVLEELIAQYPKLKISSVVLRSVLKPAYSSVLTFSDSRFSRLSKIISTTLLGWLMRLTVR